MKLTAEEFSKQPYKAITFIGMSGAGKTHTACRLAEWGWESYSCDYLIGTRYLREMIDRDATIEVDDIGSLSAFVGQIGDPKRGGLPLEEFRRRQKLYYDAECAVLRNMGAAMQNAHKEGRSFVNDAAGSLCEIEDEKLLAEVGKKSLFVYLKVSQEDHAEILRRAINAPKPLYFPPKFFKERLAAYMAEFDLKSDNEIDPGEFLRWVFLYLLEARLPKYQRLADKYGVTIPVAKMRDIKSEGDFLSCVEAALKEQQ